jgi:hypothetical protein
MGMLQLRAKDGHNLSAYGFPRQHARRRGRDP